MEGGMEGANLGGMMPIDFELFCHLSKAGSRHVFVQNVCVCVCVYWVCISTDTHVTMSF